MAAGARSSGRAGRECWRGPHLGASARAMRPARGKGSRTLPRRGPWGEREGGQEGALRPRGLQKEGWGLERVRRPSVGRAKRDGRAEGHWKGGGVVGPLRRIEAADAGGQARREGEGAALRRQKGGEAPEVEVREGVCNLLVGRGSMWSVRRREGRCWSTGACGGCGGAGGGLRVS